MALRQSCWLELANSYDLFTALSGDSGLFFDADTRVHLGLYGVTSSRDELGVVSFNGLEGNDASLQDKVAARFEPARLRVS